MMCGFIFWVVWNSGITLNSADSQKNRTLLIACFPYRAQSMAPAGGTGNLAKLQILYEYTRRLSVSLNFDLHETNKYNTTFCLQ